MNRWVVDAATGEGTSVPLTAEEAVQAEKDRQDADTRRVTESKRPAPFSDDEITRLRALLAGR